MLAWTVAAADGGDGTWLPGRLGDIVDWLDDVDPVLGGR
jgi:hypothetical protein